MNANLSDPLLPTRISALHRAAGALDERAAARARDEEAPGAKPLIPRVCRADGEEVVASEGAIPGAVELDQTAHAQVAVRSRNEGPPQAYLRGRPSGGDDRVDADAKRVVGGERERVRLSAEVGLDPRPKGG